MPRATGAVAATNMRSVRTPAPVDFCATAGTQCGRWSLESGRAPNLSLVPSAPALRARGPFGVPHGCRNRRRNRARTQVRWVARSCSADGTTHGATLVPGRRRVGTFRLGTPATLAHARTRARLQSGGASGDRTFSPVARSRVANRAASHTRNAIASPVDTVREGDQRFSCVCNECSCTAAAP